MRRLRTLAALGALTLPAAGLAACGDSLPGNAVARVGDTSVTKDELTHWLKVAAVSAQGQTGAPVDPKKVQVPQPPDFAACVADKKKTAPKPAKGQPTITDAQYKTQCKQEYESLRDQVLQFLVSSEWIKGEADEQNIKLSDAEVRKQLAKTKQQSFPKEADYQKFLTASGMTQDDILFRVRVDTLSTKLREKITKGKDKVSAAQIAAYYTKNKARFAQPERRDLRIVLTKSRAKALQAKKALASGQSFKAVAKKFSVDQQSKDQGGALIGVAKGQQEKALDDAVFAAKKGKVRGPVKTQFGFYDFEVTKVTPASQQSLAQATPTIKQLLASQNQQKALDAFVKDFRAEWKGKTNCRDGFKLYDVCKGAPKPKTTTTAAPGQVPQQQGGAPQQAPPQGGAPQQAPATP